jgi:rRNA maturation RNase YbeY
LFGSKSGSGIPGAILIQDDQKAILNIDLNRLQRTAFEVRKHLAATKNGDDYETYDVSIFLVDDEAMREANHESRKINKPTDILSFQFHDAIAPGELEKPLLDVADYYNLGDILIDVPYVIRSCQDDQRETSSESSADNDEGVEEEAEEEGEEDVWVDDDRGVSGAMSKVFDPELRINMLLIHGMLHLVGYDHEDDADYELMVKKEEEILEILKRNGILKFPTPLP